MFMLRCVFWLSVMISALPVGRGLWAAVSLPSGRNVQVAEAAMATRIGDWCAARRAGCMEDAASLTALVAATAVDNATPARDRDRATVRRRFPKPVLTTQR